MNPFRVALALALAVGLLGTAPANATPPERVDVLIGFTVPPGPAEEEMVRGMGGDIKHTFQLVAAIAANVPVTAIPGISRNPRVRYVEPDQVVRAVVQTTPWGIDRIFGDEGYVFPTWSFSTGAGLAVAVLDTGIDKNHIDLPSLLHGTNTIDDTDWGIDLAGHGTHVAGTIAALDNTEGVVGVAPNVGLYAVKVLGGVDGEGTDSSVAAGIEWAVTNGILVVNMSLGGPDYSQTLEEACDAAYALGHLLIAAAGNKGEGVDTVLYPAKYASVIAVAASDQLNERAWFSSTGLAVELIAPGQNVYSTYPNDSYFAMSGTSMATPHVAGVAALVWAANPLLSNEQIRRILRDTAEDLWLDSNHQGHGLVRADLAVAAAISAPSVTTMPATGAGKDFATLHMSYALGGFDSVDVRFVHKKVDDANWPSPVWVSKTTDGTHSEMLTGLDFRTEYMFRAELQYGSPSTVIGGDVLQFRTADLVLYLTKGWNLVSVPLTLDPEQDGPFQVFEGAVDVYTWNASTEKSYAVPDYIEPERGYWVAVTADHVIPIDGMPVEHWTEPVYRGWNLVGSVYGSPVAVVDLTTDVDPDPLLRNTFYWWDPEDKSYETASSIVQGRGYWVATTETCSLTMTAPPP